MLSLEKYFDNAATTPVDPEVAEAMEPYWAEVPGNPNSIHVFGIKARAAVTEARERVAELIGAGDPSQIFFTSGATESNNWAIALHSTGQVSPFEHPSVLEPALQKGFRVAPNDGYRLKWTPGGGLCCCMAVSNETGAVFDRPDSCNALLVDATQAIGKVPFSVGDADYVSISSHKIYGPKGVGTLYVRDPRLARPLIAGGGQQQGLRSGTLNVPGIVGFGKAAEIALKRLEEDAYHFRKLREIVLNVLEACPEMHVHESDQLSPHILCLSFEGIEGETLVLEADARGYAISSGAACSSEKKEPNKTLMALGVPEDLIRGTIRISFGRYNTVESAFALATLVLETVQRLRKMRLLQQNAT